MFEPYELEAIEAMAAFVESLEAQAYAMYHQARQLRATLGVVAGAVHRVAKADKDAAKRQTPPETDAGEAPVALACLHPVEARLRAPVMGHVNRFHCRICMKTVDPEEATV